MREITKKPQLKPIVLETKHNFIGVIVLICAGIGIAIKWTEFHDFFIPKDVFLNWKFFALCVIISVTIIWFIMNGLWEKEFDAHKLTQKDRDNLMDELKISENERLTDIITGIPNTRSLEKDIKDYFSNRSQKKMQFILIDLKNFRKINRQFGYNKTNNLLRLIAQSIYKKMRRNEDMYKYFDGENRRPESRGSFYRVYPGGDEFAFIIEGDQSDAIGFSNRLVDQFKVLSNRTVEILGENIKLSFHCAIIEMDSRDTFNDIFKKAEDCYQIAKEGVSDFTMCWHPINLEQGLSLKENKKNNYERSRQLFQVLTLNEIE